MQRTRFENRAKWLSYNTRHSQGKPMGLPVTTSRGDFWRNNVKNREDIITYYQLYYPELGDQLTQAIANTIEKAMKKETVLEDHWYTKDGLKKVKEEPDAEEKTIGKDDSVDWDFMAEINQQRIIALSPAVNQQECAEQNWTPAIPAEKDDEDVA